MHLNVRTIRGMTDVKAILSLTQLCLSTSLESPEQTLGLYGGTDHLDHELYIDT